MDKVIIKDKTKIKTAIIEKCGTCVYGKAFDLQETKVPRGWVYCIRWNGMKPFNGYCSEWKS